MANSPKPTSSQPPNSDLDSEPAVDPSMEDILASIRRILNEDEAPKSAPDPTLPGAGPPSENVLMLEPSMMVPENPDARPSQSNGPGPGPLEAASSAPSPSGQPNAAASQFVKVGPVQAQPELARAQPEPAREATNLSNPESSSPVPPPMPPADTGNADLVAPSAAAAAGASVEALMRTLASERNTSIQRGGPTIEDLVRAEIRPVLKAWLDVHLPPLVERLVRIEIERVVSRMAP